MQCEHPISIRGEKQRCGKCIPCRITYSYNWSTRILHELPNWEKSCFITLTYNDNNLPEQSSLNFRDLTNFWKRLRKTIEPKKIKYFSCGEYGDKTMRPHYHAILFGLDNTDKKLIWKCWDLCDYERLTIGRAEPKSINYVTGYILKKYSGKLAKKTYEENGLEPPDTRISSGIGLNWAKKNINQITKNGYITVNGKKAGIPRYYREKLNIPVATNARPLINQEWGGTFTSEMLADIAQRQTNRTSKENISARGGKGRKL